MFCLQGTEIVQNHHSVNICGLGLWSTFLQEQGKMSDGKKLVVASCHAPNRKHVLHVELGASTKPWLHDEGKIEDVSGVREIERTPQFPQIPDLFLHFWTLIVGLKNGTIQDTKDTDMLVF